MSHSTVALCGLVLGTVLLGSANAVSASRLARTAAPLESAAVDALEAEGVRIGQIDIRVLNIFNPEDPRENTGLYKLADDIHVKTREHAVRNQLLFRPGDLLKRQILVETERLLRSRNYFSDASVRVTGYDEVTRSVSVTVTVHDVWTLDPNVSVGRSGDRTSSVAGIADQNALGTGAAVSLLHARDVDRSSTSLSYADNNVGGSWWRLAGIAANNSDGYTRSLTLEKPFYSLGSPNAVGFSASDTVSHVSRYSSGVVEDQLALRQIQDQVYYGWSTGLVGGDVVRWLVGVRADLARVEPLPGQIRLAPVAADRQLVYPWVGWSWVEDRYQTATNIDLIGRTEDLNFGRNVYLELGYSSPSVGAGRALPFQMSVNDGWHWHDSQFLFGSMSVNGRLEDGVPRNITAKLSARYFYHASERDVVYLALTGIATDRLDADQQLLLGADNGLRGYPVRYQGGNDSVVFTVERRVYTNWFPLRLVRVGFAAFADVGRTFGRDEFGAAPFGLLKDLGIGLRLGNNRSGLGNVLHVDVTYATAADAHSGRLQFSMSTQQKF